MTRNHYTWKGGSVPIIGDHSLNKLDLLERYIGGYLDVVSMNGYAKQLPLFFVDGYSGGGVYGHNNAEVLGSPFRVLNAAREFCARIPPDSSLRPNFKFVFVDEDGDALDFLRGQINEWINRNKVPWGKDDIDVIHGNFNKECDGILRRIRKEGVRKAIFSLDQYGWLDVEVPKVWRILRDIEAPEIILTIATDWIADYLKVDEMVEAMKKMQLFDSVPRDYGEELQRAKDMEGEIFRSGKTENVRRGICQKMIVKGIAEGFRDRKIYYNPYCVRSQESNKSYIILHISTHIRAKDVMLALQWELGTCVHEGNPGLKMIEFNPRDLKRGSYMFKEQDEERSAEELMTQLPEIIKDGPDISAAEFYAKIANETPARREAIYNVLRRLEGRGSISIYGPKGRSVSDIRDKTIIRWRGQTSFL